MTKKVKMATDSKFFKILEIKSSEIEHYFKMFIWTLSIKMIF